MQKKEFQRFLTLSHEFMRNPLISIQAKCLLAYLRCFKPCYPAYPLIMMELGIRSRSTLSRLLKELERHGNLRIIKKCGTSNRYEFPKEQERRGKPVQLLAQTSPSKASLPVHLMDSNKILNKNNNTPEPTLEELQKLGEQIGGFDAKGLLGIE